MTLYGVRCEYKGTIADIYVHGPWPEPGHEDEVLRRMIVKAIRRFKRRNLESPCIANRLISTEVFHIDDLGRLPGETDSALSPKISRAFLDYKDAED